MESRYGPASHCHKQNWEQVPHILDIESRKCRRLDCRIGRENPNNACCQDRIQKKRAQVVPRLQEDPDRRDRREEYVHEQDDLPKIVGTHRVTRERDGKSQPKSDTAQQQGHAYDRR